MNRLAGVFPGEDYRGQRRLANATFPAMAYRRFLSRERIPGAALALASLLLLGYTLASDNFYVYYPQVSGNLVTPAEKIIIESEIQGYQIFFVHPQQAAEAVAQLPDIARVTIRFSLPNNLDIEVEEREPHIAWQVGEDTFLLDNQGHVLSPQSAEVGITIRDLSTKPLQPGDQVSAEILRAAQAYQALDPTLMQFVYSPEYGLGISTDSGTRVIFGDEERAEEKLAIWHALAAQLENKGIFAQIIDLRFAVPYYRPLVE